jgi:hypothetical protein
MENESYNTRWKIRVTTRGGKIIENAGAAYSVNWHCLAGEGKAHNCRMVTMECLGEHETSPEKKNQMKAREQKTICTYDEEKPRTRLSNNNHPSLPPPGSILLP